MHRHTPQVPAKYWDTEMQEMYRNIVLGKLKDEMVTAIQNILVSQKLFKNSDGSKLAESVSAYVENGTIIIHSEYAHFKYQNDGVRSHTMWYLMGKTVPIKDTATGKIIYRKVTLNSFLKGKWRHKGYDGKHYIESGINQAMLQFPRILYEAKVEIEESMLGQRGSAQKTGTFGW